MDMKKAVIYRMRELIRQIDITVNEAAKRFGIPPSTLKNILYGQSKNVGVITIKKLCDGLGLTSLIAELKKDDLQISEFEEYYI